MSGSGPFFQPRGQRLALHALHHEVVDAILTANVVQRADVHLIQRRNRAGFALETLPRVGRVGEMLRQNFDRDGAIQASVARPIDLAHPACPERSGHLVRAEPGTWREAHRVLSPGVEGPAPKGARISEGPNLVPFVNAMDGIDYRLIISRTCSHHPRADG